MEQRQDGFTVIEVMLFLAISALLLVGALMGVSRSINTTRFNDAVNSTVSYLQKEYAAVSNGQNVRGNGLVCNELNAQVGTGSSVPGMTNCVVLGRLIEFSVGGNTLTSRYIVGRDTATSATNDTAAVLQATPKIVSQDGLQGTFDVPWSTELDKMTRGTTPVNNLAFIKSPTSGRILIYSFTGTGLNGLDNTLLQDSGTGNTLNQPVSICLNDGGGRIGFVRVGSGQGQDIVRADLAATGSSCP